MDKYAELRAALDAGPTPGPWTMDGTGTRALVRGADLTIVAVRHRLSGQAHEANARLIAAANPAVIHALLAERDALREALEIARDFVAEALAQERDAYRGHESVSSIADIERYLAQIDAALAQGQGEQHDNQGR
ncbi:hypothetical protein G5B41_17540 [bacterium SGD-2]|nr:hypothetical protein [bacterium SGD-2]